VANISMRDLVGGIADSDEEEDESEKDPEEESG